MQTKAGKGHASGIVPEGNTAQARHPVGRAMDQEAVQVVVAPSKGTLKDLMEFGEARVAGHEQSPPHQRAYAAEHDAKLINRRGRYRRFRHAGTLPKSTRMVLSLTPRNLLLSPAKPWRANTGMAASARAGRRPFAFRVRVMGHYL